MSSVYVHIPFCLRKCIYCDFRSVPLDGGLAARYAEALCKEIILRGGGGPVETVYIGGGTPTVLPEESLGEIFGAVRRAFELAPPAEITVEANPGTVDEKKLDALLGGGANRLSIGIQSLSDRELSFLGRAHNAAEAVKSVKMAQRAGFENISADLIFGIPGQTLEGWRETLMEAIGLGVGHFSAYELTPEEGTALMETLKAGGARMPEEGLILEMFSIALETLGGAGYEHYEVSSHAKPGLKCRHNLNYWQRGQYVGAGAGAHSFLGEKRWKNAEDIEKYIALVSSGSLPVEEAEEVSEGQAFEEAVFLGLRMTGGIPLTEALREVSEGFVREGLMEIVEGRLRLTRRGLFVSNALIAGMLSKLT